MKKLAMITTTFILALGTIVGTTMIITTITIAATPALAQTLIEYTACVKEPGNSRPQLIIVNNEETQALIDSGELKLLPLQVCFAEMNR